jgi:hypothetical protein
MNGNVPEFFFAAAPGTHTAEAVLKLSKIYETGRLGSLDLYNFKAAENAVYSLLREGRAEIFMSNTAAAHWFRKCGFKTELEHDNFVIREPEARVPDYYKKLETFFSYKMAEKYKSLSSFESRDPFSSLEAASAVLNSLNENCRHEIIKIIRNKGARDPLATVNVLNEMVSGYFRRNENTPSFHKPHVPDMGISG